MPDFLSTIRSGHVLRPYYYGRHKWDNYLVDIQETIAALKTADTSARGGVNLDALSVTLDDLATGIEDLGAKFEWGFALMIEQQEKQIALLNQIVGQLDAIREAVQLPSTTRARELFILGQKDLRRGLYPEALQKFLAAERENQVNFPLQLQIGKLFLYGKNATDNVIDLLKSEQHFFLASRYAGRSQKWLKYHGVALFHAAIAAYLIGEQEKLAGRTDSMRKCLERALDSIKFPVTTWPVAELYYLAAKCRVLLGHKDRALANLKILAERDPVGYSAKVNRDMDFSPVRTAARDIFYPVVEKIKTDRAARLRRLNLPDDFNLPDVVEWPVPAGSWGATPSVSSDKTLLRKCSHSGQVGNFCSLCGSPLGSGR